MSIDSASMSPPHGATRNPAPADIRGVLRTEYSIPDVISPVHDSPASLLDHQQDTCFWWWRSRRRVPVLHRITDPYKIPPAQPDICDERVTFLLNHYLGYKAALICRQAVPCKPKPKPKDTQNVLLLCTKHQGPWNNLVLCGSNKSMTGIRYRENWKSITKPHQSNIPVTTTLKREVRSGATTPIFNPRF